MIRRLHPALLACCLSVVAVTADAGENWERFRGPNGSGSADDKKVPVRFSEQDNLIWKTAIPGAGNGSPIVWGDRIFVHTANVDGSERSLLCLDVRTGSILWTRSIPGTKVKIRYDSSMASSTPTTDGSAVYIAFWDGKDIIMSAYDFQGAPLWSTNLGPFISQHGAGGSPILYKDKILFANDMDKDDPVTKVPVSRPSFLIALNKKTGELAWEVPREPVRACYSPPFLHAGKGGAPELMVLSTTGITAYNPDTGAKLWELAQWQAKTVRMPLRTIASPTIVGDVVVATSGDGAGDRYAAGVSLGGTGKSAERLWDNNKDFPYVPCPLSVGAHIYFVNDKGFAGCYEATSGKRIWQERQPDSEFQASPLLIDGKIYAGSLQGDVFVFAAEPTYKLLARNTLGERIRATPAVAHDRLYIRGDKHLFCIGAK